MYSELRNGVTEPFRLFKCNGIFFASFLEKSVLYLYYDRSKSRLFLSFVIIISFLLSNKNLLCSKSPVGKAGYTAIPTGQTMFISLQNLYQTPLLSNQSHHTGFHFTNSITEFVYINLIMACKQYSLSFIFQFFDKFSHI